MGTNREEKEPGSIQPSLQLTKQQEDVINSNENIVINAVAGSGKTSTIIQYAACRQKGKKILYLAFNRSVKVDARKRFTHLKLHGVEIETVHSLAYKHIVVNSAYSISQKGYTSYDIAGQLGLKNNGEVHGEYILANHVLKFLGYFCNSAAEKVQDLNYLDIVSDLKAKTFVSNFYKEIEHATRTLLGKMHRGEMEITHDFYLKMFQLSKPRLPFDYILFDEGQDASPAMLDIFLRQASVKVIVGDANQQVYAWRHAINSLAKVSYKTYSLSASFRFSRPIAELSMQILSWKNLFQHFSSVAIEGKGKSSVVKTRATLARTNLGLLLSAITFINEHKKARQIYFEGNINSYTYADEGASLYDVLNLYMGKKDRVKRQAHRVYAQPKRS